MKYNKLIALALLTITLGSCEGRLDIDNPNKPTDNTFWKTKQTSNRQLHLVILR